MVYVHYEDIKVPEGRFRERFDPRDLDELRDSIAQTGLLHPLAVEPDPTDDKFILRAGERRLRVIIQLHEQGIQFRHGNEQVARNLVPVSEWSQLTERQRVEIEVEENLRRRDFTMQERARAVERLHLVRKAENPKQTLRDTATEIQRLEGKGDEPASSTRIEDISTDLIIAKHLDNPDVAKAGTKKEALRIIRKQAEYQHQARLAKVFDPKKTPHTLLKGDSLEHLAAIPENSFDVILTDPPYGVGADSFGDMAATGHDYKDSLRHWEGLFKELPDHLYRVAKKEAHLYLFCDLRRFERLSTLLVLANWTVFPVPLIWVKGNGMLPFPKHGPRRTYECIAYAWKGNKEVLEVMSDTILNIPGLRENMKNGAQKPVALYCNLLSRSARPGDKVLDCFGGSGTILPACNIKQCVATYIEQDENQYNIATQRANTRSYDDGSEEEDGISIDFGVGLEEGPEQET